MKSDARRFDLLVIGEINPDIMVIADDPVPEFRQTEKLVDSVQLGIGSSSAIFACGAARLGLRTAFIGIVGDDLFGRYMLEALTQRAIDVSACVVDPDRPTGASVVLSGPGDRAILTAKGTIGTLRVDQVPRAVLHDARHLHVGSYFLLDSARQGLPAFFEEARAGGLTTSLDCNWDPTGSWDGGLDEMLAAADLFFPNAEEARRISGLPDHLAAGRALVSRAAAKGNAGLTVGLKRGEHGALAIRQSEHFAAPAHSVKSVDTTGAGDSFDAGFLYGWLNGWPLERCLQLGIACGSLSTRRPGGTDGQPTLSEALAVLP